MNEADQNVIHDGCDAVECNGRTVQEHNIMMTNVWCRVNPSLSNLEMKPECQETHASSNVAKPFGHEVIQNLLQRDSFGEASSRRAVILWVSLLLTSSRRRHTARQSRRLMKQSLGCSEGSGNHCNTHETLRAARHSDEFQYR